MPVAEATWVNFLADDLGKAEIARWVAATPLRGFEIKTVKLKLKK